MKVAVCPHLPVKRIPFILSSDLAGGMFFPFREEPELCDTDVLSHEFPSRFKACCVVRAQALKMENIVDPSEYFMVSDIPVLTPTEAITYPTGSKSSSWDRDHCSDASLWLDTHCCAKK